MVVNEIHDTLVAGQLDDRHGVAGEVLLDTGCVRTVSSRTWMNNFIKTLSARSRENIKVFPSSKIFRFGGGEKRTSLGLY